MACGHSPDFDCLDYCLCQALQASPCLLVLRTTVSHSTLGFLLVSSSRSYISDHCLSRYCGRLLVSLSRNHISYHHCLSWHHGHLIVFLSRNYIPDHCLSQHCGLLLVSSSWSFSLSSRPETTSLTTAFHSTVGFSLSSIPTLITAMGFSLCFCKETIIWPTAAPNVPSIDLYQFRPVTSITVWLNRCRLHINSIYVQQWAIPCLHSWSN